MQANYYCPFCGSSTVIKIRDLGKLPNEIDCDNCEGTAVIQEEEPKYARRSDYVLLMPNDWEMIRHRKAEEAKYIKRGFSLVECKMLFEYEVKKLEQKELILIKNTDL